MVLGLHGLDSMLVLVLSSKIFLMVPRLLILYVSGYIDKTSMIVLPVFILLKIT